MHPPLKKQGRNPHWVVGIQRPWQANKIINIAAAIYFYDLDPATGLQISCFVLELDGWGESLCSFTDFDMIHMSDDEVNI